MNKYLTTAALVLALAMPGFANAAPKPAAKVAPASEATQQKAPTYAEKKAHAVEVMTQFRDALNELPLAQLNAELAKLPGFEKAYVDAKNAKDDAAAAQASADYAASVQAINKFNNKIAGTIQQAGRMGIMLGMQLGDDAEKISKEPDFVAVQTQIGNRVKALNSAGKASMEAVGALVKATQAQAAERFSQEREKIFDQTLRDQVGNHLQAKLAE